MTEPFIQYERYFEPAWDGRRLNNLNQRFVTAFLGATLHNNAEMAAYLDVPVVRSNDGVHSVNADGTPDENHTYWPGFKPRTALGMSLHNDG